MATIISGVNCAENFQQVAIMGSSVGDPIPDGIGCLTEADFDTIDAASVAIFYEPALTASEPSNAPQPYTAQDATNQLITIPLNNFFDDQRRVFSAQSTSLPYDKAAIELTKQANKSASQNAKIELACLAHEGTAVSGDAITAANIVDTILGDITTIRNTGAAPTIAICTPEVYTKLVSAAGDSLKGAESDARWLNAQVGYFLGVLWVAHPALAKDTASYYDKSGTKQTVDFTNVQYIMWDGSKFAAIERITEFSIKDGGASFSGSAACMSSMFGVALLEKTACLVRSASV